MGTISRLLAAVTGAGLLVGGLSAPAVAAGDGPPVITSPVDGSTVTRGFAGPLTVDLSGAVLGTYDVEVASANGLWSEDLGPVTTTADTTTVALTLDQPLTKPGAYVAKVTGVDTAQSAESSFSIAGAAAPEVLDPRDGSTTDQTVDAVTIRLDDAPVGDYDVEVRSADGRRTYGSDLIASSQTSPDDVRVGLATPITGTGSYVVEVTGEGFDTTSTFSVDRVVAVSDLSVSPRTFYPRVRDGFRDSTRARFSTDEQAEVTVTVRDAAGRRVDRDRLGTLDTGRHSWRWNGRDAAGDLVPRGRYDLTVRARDDQGSDGSTVSVRVATKVVHHSDSAVRLGHETTSRSHRGNCRIYRIDGLHLDCWGGRYAEATYRFRVPAAAKNRDIGFRVRGSVGCCSPGRVVKSGTRVSPRAVVVRVEVTRWRAYEIRRVRLDWSWTTRR